MMKYEELAKEITERVGGKENISSLTHCVTRLRFKLKDENLAKTDELKKMDGVVTVMQAGGQYQVVIGNHVPDVYAEVMKHTGAIVVDEHAPKEKQKFFDRLIDILSGCFQPFLGILCASGMIKGLSALLSFFIADFHGSGIAVMLDAIGDAIFYFLPIVIGITAARKFHLPEFTGLALGGALIYPSIQASALAGSGAEPLMVLFQGTIFESPIYQTILGIPFISQNYASSVVPIIFIIWFASYVQKAARKMIPEVVRSFFVPFTVLLVTMPVAFLVIGPVLSMATNVLSALFNALIGFSPAVYGLILGAFWQVLVMFGLHWAVIPLAIAQTTLQGYSVILAPIVGVSFAQIAVVAALYFKLKDEKQKALFAPALISGIAGVTEPAIYGITLPRKKAFIISCIAGGISGFVGGFLNLTAYSIGALGIFMLPSFISPDGNVAGLFISLAVVVLAMVLAFIMTLVFYKEPQEEGIVEAVVEPDIFEELIKHYDIKSPLHGTVRPLATAADQVFAEGHMGQGVVVDPIEGEVHSPFNGTVQALFPTKHAIGIVSEEGVEMLIHVGMDTVTLNGEGFETLVQVGDQITEGQLLIKFDIETIQKAGLKIETPVIITNSASFKKVQEVTGEMDFGNFILSID